MSNSTHESGAGRGAVAAIAAYVMWGLFPLFWKQLEQFDATELIAHRVVWSLVIVMGVTTASGAWKSWAKALGTPRLAGLHLLSGVCLSVNWLTFVWGVNHGYILESSLGYYLVPLVNVACGRLLLGEQLRRAQIIAIVLAAVGVTIQLASSARIPWVALLIAVSWASYGLLRKRSSLGSLAGLSIELTLLVPVAAGYLGWLAMHGQGAAGHITLLERILIPCTGLVTAVPLLLFAYGVRRLRLGTVGFLQYIVPTLQFLVGALVYGETVDRSRLVSFGFIWVALAIYSADNLRLMRAAPRA